ncbi:putative transposase [Rhodovulum bhavnagarense]|uniref:Putative transposase n=1 Tax=Rhodovulum bhavnagarense TaxID=992286 RepID=A0A4R2RFE2_9RHOB|nr:RNA-guided endonuclease TnpB family protein [Rhodovulum bhavnagarense]TCP58381.1 putative transposase [Rhodovulum bhavnagarense]
MHTHEAQVVLKRLDLAFRAFFRRLRTGGKPGFPRFRSAERFRGWGYKEHGNGFKVEMRPGWRHGHVTLFGIGRRRARGWMLNLVVETDCAERARAEGPAIGLDWGVSTFATIAHEDGSFEEVANARPFDRARADLCARQHRLSAAARARKISRAALKRHREALARQHAKLAAKRKDFLHKISARIAGRHWLVATEALAVQAMTGSACGTAKAPGRNVAAKAGLNRSILDAAPAAFLNMLRYKAEGLPSIRAADQGLQWSA